MKQPLLSLRPLSVSLLLLVFVFHSVYPLDYSYDEESDFDQNECGVPYYKFEPRIDSRIVGGIEAEPHSWPWQARMMRYTRQYGWHDWCGGTVLNSHWVITAAHCVYELNVPAYYKIVLGDHTITKEEGTEQIFETDVIFTHPNYDNITVVNDIALIHLPKHVQFNRYIKPICLPDKDVKVGTYCVTTGWGETYSTGNQEVLNQVYVKVINNRDCNQPNWYDGEVTDNMICAGYADGGRDSCQGDSGGPLVSLSDGKWKLVGVTSWGLSCAKPQSPGIYTRVTDYLKWIQKITKQYNY